MNKAYVRKALGGINVVGCPVKSSKNKRCPGVALIPVSLLEQAHVKVFSNLSKVGVCLSCGTKTEFIFKR